MSNGLDRWMTVMIAQAACNFGLGGLPQITSPGVHRTEDSIMRSHDDVVAMHVISMFELVAVKDLVNQGANGFGFFVCRYRYEGLQRFALASVYRTYAPEMSENPELPLPDGVTSRYLQVRDLQMHVLEAGCRSSPLILLLHGFPELAYSWRHIMLPLARSGYFVVAPDQRGYGRTHTISSTRVQSYDDDICPYRMVNLTHDIVALMHVIGHNVAASVVGHDFGSPVAAHCALIRPDLFHSVVCMSAPYTGPPSLPFNVTESAANAIRISPAKLLDNYLRGLSPPLKHYTIYFSQRPTNDQMLSPRQGLRGFLRAYFHVKSADWAGNRPHPLTNISQVSGLPHYYAMPIEATMPEAVLSHAPSELEINSNQWLPESELSVFVQEYQRTGFQGGLNWYRAMTDDILGGDSGLFAGRNILVPAMFISGAQDWGVHQVPGSLLQMRRICTSMDERNIVLVEGAGHWVQQEQPQIVVGNILRFLDDH